MTWAPRDHARQLKSTVSAAYVASAAGLDYEDFIVVATSLGFRTVQGRLTRSEAPRVVEQFIAGTNDPKRLARLQMAVYRLAEDGPGGLS